VKAAGTSTATTSKVHKLVFGATVCQTRTPASATVISPAIAAARKRAREQEYTLGSESTLLSDDRTFQPNTLGGAATYFEEYCFANNESELSSI
jgi:hypothetical protein